MSGRKFTSPGAVPVLCRLAPDVIEHLDKAAAAALRSRSAEILMRLRQSMEGESFDVHGCIVKQAPAASNVVDDHQGGGH